MKTYKVNIDFKKGASFSAEASSIDEEVAKKHVLILARKCGFDAQVKKITVTETA